MLPPQNKSAVKLKMEMKVREGSDKNERLHLEHASSFYTFTELNREHGNSTSIAVMFSL